MYLDQSMRTRETLNSSNSTLQSPQSVLRNSQFTCHTLHFNFTLHTSLSTLHTLHTLRTLHPLHPLHPLRSRHTLHTPHYTLHSKFRTALPLHTPYSPLRTLHSLHSTFEALQIILCTFTAAQDSKNDVFGSFAIGTEFDPCHTDKAPPPDHPGNKNPLVNRRKTKLMMFLHYICVSLKLPKVGAQIFGQPHIVVLGQQCDTCHFKPGNLRYFATPVGA